MQLSTREARSFLAIKHFESVSPSDNPVNDVVQVVRALGCVQYDPLNVVGRNADLTFQSRLPEYRAVHLRDALYKERALVDGFDKNLALYPSEDFPAFARARRGVCAWFRENETIRSALPGVLDAVRARGALCSDDIDLVEKVRWPWGESRLSRAALETLWMEGRLGIARRNGSRRYYDLIERCLPGDVAERPDPFPEDGDFYAWLLRRRVGAVGMLWNRASDALLLYNGRPGTEVRKAAFDSLLKREAVIPVEVEGLRDPLYILSEDRPLAEDVIAGREPQLVMRAIAPLDPLLWDRNLIEAIYGFRYRWEVYTPVAKREYGYYVLPVMLAGDFAGRFEPKPFRSGKLEIANWWKEAGVKETPAYRHCKAEWRGRFQRYLDSCL